MELKDDVAWNCVWPAIEKVRGKNNKKEIYSSLNDGQKALFSFYSYFNHASKSSYDFMHYTEMYLEMGFMSEIVKELSYFRNRLYIEFIEKVINESNGKKWDSYFYDFVELGNNHIKTIQEEVRGKIDYYQYEMPNNRFDLIIRPVTIRAE